MKTLRGYFAALIASSLVPATALSQQGGDPETSILPELVVTARLPGPVWWTVKKGDATVWILAAPVDLPKGFAWDRSVLERRVAQSRAVILPPEGAAGIWDIFGIMSASAKMKHAGRLEDRAPGALRTRFLDAVAKLGKSPGAYDHVNGLMAGMNLSQDFRRQAGLDTAEPEVTIVRVARGHHVRVYNAATYKVMPVIRESVGEVTENVEWSCLDAALDEVEGGKTRADAAAAGWARGDTREALTAGRGFEACINAVPAGANLSRRATADEVSTIEKALMTPGNVIAVVGLRRLIAEDGVLDQLRRQGYSIHGGAGGS